MIDPKTFEDHRAKWEEHLKALGRGTKKPDVKTQPAPLKPSK